MMKDEKLCALWWKEKCKININWCIYGSVFECWWCEKYFYICWMKIFVLGCIKDYFFAKNNNTCDVVNDFSFFWFPFLSMVKDQTKYLRKLAHLHSNIVIVGLFVCSMLDLTASASERFVYLLPKVSNGQILVHYNPTNYSITCISGLSIRLEQLFNVNNCKLFV